MTETTRAGGAPDAGETAEERVAVVVPAYNAGATLARTLDSILAQTAPVHEIVVVDDGSGDDTRAVAEGYAARDRRVRVLSQPNAGPSAARNTGIAATGAPLVAFLDADDLWHPDKLRRQLLVLRERGPRCGMVYTWSWKIDQNDRLLSQGHMAESWEGDVYAALVLHNIVGNGSTPLFRREAIAAVGGFDESMRTGCEDLAFYLALAERYEVAVVAAVLVGYRQSPTSISLQIDGMRAGFEKLAAEIRAARPELPARVLGWARAKVCLHLGRRCLHRGRVRDGRRPARPRAGPRPGPAGDPRRAPRLRAPSGARRHRASGGRPPVPAAAAGARAIPPARRHRPRGPKAGGSRPPAPRPLAGRRRSGERPGPPAHRLARYDAIVPPT